MSDENQHDGPEIAPETDAHIRSLLAELGSGPDGEEIPPEVAARLDDTLARLVAERAAPDETAEPDEQRPGTVVPLRRRWLPRLTAAAAAVVVLGAGGVAASTLGLFDGQTDSLSTSDAGGGTSSQAETAPSPTGGNPGADQDGADQDGAAQDGAALALPAIRSVTFAADVKGLVDTRTPALSTPERGLLREDQLDAAGKAAPSPSQACPGPRITDGAVPNLVRYDGTPAVLVVHPVSAGKQLVEAWDCSGGTRLAATTLTP